MDLELEWARSEGSSQVDLELEWARSEGSSQVDLELARASICTHVCKVQRNESHQLFPC